MRNIRPYHVDDGKHLGEMLLMEGLKPDDMGFATWDTYVYDDGELKGFYTYKINNGFPYLVHLCVDREYRTASIARALIGDFKKRVKTRFIINAPEGTKVDRVVKRYLNAEPYANKDKHNFYIGE